MPNIASVLKNEIVRVSRKEARAETSGLKKTIAPYRSEIAALKRSTKALEIQVRRLSKLVGKVTPAAPVEKPARTVRFSAKGLAAQRHRLGLSASDYGRLVGVSDQSIYKWEDGKVRPRDVFLPAIAAIRALSKKAAAAQLESMG